MKRSITAAVMLALAVVLAPPAAAAPVVAPGDVLTAEPVDLPGFSYADAWHITYRSTSATGQPNTVSGTVIVPFGSDDSTPVIGYAPGTHGIGDECAPSAALQRGDDYEEWLIHQYGFQGFAVAVTDYEGLGTPGIHTYTAGRSQGQAVLDVVRAAQRLPETGLSSDAPAAVVGYSQGGQSAGWAAEIAPSYAPELNLKAFSVGGPAADLRRTAEANDGGPNMSLVLQSAIGLDAAYPELDLADSITAAGKAAYADLTRDDCTSEGSYGGHTLDEYATPGLLDSPDWATRVAQQKLGTAAPRGAVLLYHSTGDEILPVDQAVALASAWCGRRARVRFWQTNTGGHAFTAAWLSPDVTDWVAARLAGNPDRGNC